MALSRGQGNPGGAEREPLEAPGIMAVMLRAGSTVIVWALAWFAPAPNSSILEEVSSLDPEARLSRLGAHLTSAGSSLEARVAVCEGLLRQLQSQPDPASECGVREWHWRLLQGLARFDEARSTARQWRECAEQTDVEAVVGDAYLAEGLTAFELGEFDLADRAVENAVDRYNPQKDVIRLANAISIRGGIAFRVGDYAKSTTLHEESLRLGEEADNLPLQARAWNNLGIVYKNLGSVGDACDAYRASHELFLEIGDEDTAMSVLRHLASALREQGDLDEALELHTQVLDYHLEQGNRVEEVSDRTALGLTLSAMDLYEDAVQELRLALELRREVGLIGSLSRSLFDLGKILLDGGEPEEALVLLEEARDSLGEVRGILERDIYQVLVETYLELGEEAKAARAFRHFVAVERELTSADLTAKNAELATRFELAAAQSAKERERTDQAIDELTRQFELAEKESELDRLRSQQLVERGEQRAKVFVLVAGCSILALFCVSLVWFSRTRARLLQRSRKSERLYRCLFEDESSGRVLVDPSTGSILQANRLAVQWLGDGSTALEGKNLRELAPDLPLNSSSTSWQTRNDLGDESQIEVSSSEVVIERGPVNLVTLRDVTTQRRLEEEQSRAQTLDSLSLLAAGIAHDFNNALTAILGHVSAARSIGKEEDTDELLEEAEDAALRAGQLANQLLGFARGGTPVLKIHRLDSQIERWVSFSRSGSAVNVCFDLQKELWPAKYDEGQLAQVLSNLVLNAQEAMGGQGTLHVSAKNVVVKEGEWPDLQAGNYVRVVINDSGPGVASALRKKIFTPYFSTKNENRGLGLATSYAVLKRHEGVLRLSSEPGPGRGATFEIFIPAHPGSEWEMPTEPERLPQGRGHVLVIDDEPMVRAAFRLMLIKLGYDVTAVPDGQAAIREWGERGPFDLAVIDATIPGGTGGKAALDQLRSAQPSIHAILTSGYSDEGILAKYRSQGFEGMLKKPFRIRDLAEAIREVFPEKARGRGAGGTP